MVTTGYAHEIGLLLASAAVVRSLAVLVREVYAGRARLTWAKRRSPKGNVEGEA